ncbi:MAG: glycerate kinase [Candidatus Dormibacteria bacterium]
MAPNAFKGSLSAPAAAVAIARGVRRARPDLVTDLLPLSDGGDGFLDAMAASTSGQRRQLMVRGPLHSPVSAAFVLAEARPDGVPVLAVVESAQSSGMALLAPAELDPLGASTGGLGEVLAEARHLGAGSFLIGIGGTATMDGGTGMARVLGYRFLDRRGVELPEGAGSLARLEHIDASGFDPAWLLLDLDVACDVDSPLLGPTGAARVFGPQKGASADEVEAIEAGLARLAEVVVADLGQDVVRIPGAGAAGGLGAGLVAFLGARLVPGSAAVLAAVNVDSHLAACGVAITGEGRLDDQSLVGKVPVEFGRRARAAGVRSLAVAGSLGPGWEGCLEDAFDEVVAAAPPGMPLAEALRDAAALLETAAAKLLS